MKSDLLMQRKPWDDSMRQAHMELQTRWSQTALARRDHFSGEAARCVVARRFTETPFPMECEREQLRCEVFESVDLGARQVELSRIYGQRGFGINAEAYDRWKAQGS